MGIVTDQLKAYWHYQQGFGGSTWENIAPDTKGQYNGAVNGAILQSDGVYFDGKDDVVVTTDFPSAPSFTIEVIAKYTKDAQYTNLVPFSYYSALYVRGHLRLITQNVSRNYSWWDNQGAYTESPTGILTKNTILHYTVVVNNEDVTLYFNGIKQTGKRAGVAQSQIFGGKVYLGSLFYNGYHDYRFEGHLCSAKVYHKALTDQEVLQNYQVGTAIGLEDEPPMQEPPKPTIINISRETISANVGVNISYVTFKFDQDVTQWTVNVLGTSYNTGTVAESGGAVLAGVEITAEVDWTELYQEGQNRINIYGKGLDGQWTPYES